MPFGSGKRGNLELVVPIQETLYEMSPSSAASRLLHVGLISN